MISDILFKKNQGETLSLQAFFIYTQLNWKFNDVLPVSELYSVKILDQTKTYWRNSDYDCKKIHLEWRECILI